MDTLYRSLAVFIMMNVVAGGVRIFLGPTRADRMLAGQFLGTSCVALFLILAEMQHQPSFRNLALVFVTLAALTSIAFVKAYSDPAKVGL